MDQKPEIKIAVTGGRVFQDKWLVEFVLTNIAKGHNNYSFFLIHGDATGLDTIAKEVAIKLGWGTKPYPVTKEDWKAKGLRAGPERNLRMLTESKPHILLSFPGGKGTVDCIKKAGSLGLPVVSFYNAPDLTLYGRIDQARTKIDLSVIKANPNLLKNQ